MGGERVLGMSGDAGGGVSEGGRLEGMAPQPDSQAGGSGEGKGAGVLAKLKSCGFDLETL